MEIFKSNRSLCFLPNFAQNLLYTRNDQTKTKKTLKYPKWKFSSQTVSGLFVKIITPNFFFKKIYVVT